MVIRVTPLQASYFRVFRATTFTYIQLVNRTKLNYQCIKGDIGGYEEPYGVKSY